MKLDKIYQGIFNSGQASLTSCTRDIHTEADQLLAALKQKDWGDYLGVKAKLALLLCLFIERVMPDNPHPALVEFRHLVRERYFPYQSQSDFVYLYKRYDFDIAKARVEALLIQLMASEALGESQDYRLGDRNSAA